MNTEATTVSRRASLGRHLRKNAVAYLALFVAFSLSPVPGYAAKALVGTNGIKNGAVTTPKLHDKAVTNGKLADNAVKSGKIKNGQVKKIDLAGSARGFTNVVARSVAVSDIANAASSERSVSCNAGETAIGGGAYVTPTGIVLFGATGGVVTRSHPTSNVAFGEFTFAGPTGNGGAPTGWRTVVRNDQGDVQTAVHYAMCASK